MKLLTLLICSIGMMSCTNSQNQKSRSVPMFSFPYNLSEPNKIYELPPVLKEISALSLTKDGDLACLQDEDGVIFIYDLSTGTIKDRFIFGKSNDYEGLEIVDETAYVLESDGTIIEIENLGHPTQKINKFKTDLKRKNNTEGLGYNPNTHQLLIACKGDGSLINEHDAPKAVYGFDLSAKELQPTPILSFSKKALHNFIQTHDLKDLSFKLKKKMPFNPSGITLHKEFYYTIASIGSMLIVTDQFSTIVHAEKINADLMPKAEGIVFDAFDNLYIATEGDKNTAGRILMFSPKQLEK